MSTATATKNGKAGVQVIAEPLENSVVSRLPETPDTPSSDANETPEMMALRIKAELKAAHESASVATDKAVSLADTILDGVKLYSYIAVGDAAFDAIMARKAAFDLSTAARGIAKSGWKGTDLDDWCNDYAVKVRILYPGLVKPIKEESVTASKNARKKGDSQVRVIDWIQAALAVRSITPIVGEIHNVSYDLVKVHLVPMCTFSKSDLTYGVRSEWAEFLRFNLPELMSDRQTPGEFIDAIDSHREKMANDAKMVENAGLTVAQVSAKEAEANAKTARTKAAKTERDCNEALTSSLTGALSGVLSDSKIVTIVETVEKAAGRHVLSRASFNVGEFKACLKSLVFSGQQSEVMAILEAAKLFEAALRATQEAPATLPIQPAALAS